MHCMCFPRRENSTCFRDFTVSGIMNVKPGVAAVLLLGPKMLQELEWLRAQVRVPLKRSRFQHATSSSTAESSIKLDFRFRLLVFS